MILKSDIPLTILGNYIKSKAEEDITDSISALAYLPENTSDIVKEKAVASIALDNNKTSLWDPHGFSNVVLISNSIPASVDAIAATSPDRIAYTLWELEQEYPDLVLGPETIRYIQVCLELHSFAVAPYELNLVKKFYDKKYKVAPALNKIYKMCKAAEDKTNFIKDLGDRNVFIANQLIKLTSVTEYTEQMQKIYWEYKKEI